MHGFRGSSALSILEAVKCGHWMEETPTVQIIE
jgi:hypothetical protein